MNFDFCLVSVVKKNWAKVLEACVVAAASAIILIALIYAVPNCGPIEGHHDQGHNDTHDVTHDDFEHHTNASHEVHRCEMSLKSTGKSLRCN